jgi:hypothetical protein
MVSDSPSTLNLLGVRIKIPYLSFSIIPSGMEEKMLAQLQTLQFSLCSGEYELVESNTTMVGTWKLLTT